LEKKKSTYELEAGLLSYRLTLRLKTLIYTNLFHAGLVNETSIRGGTDNKNPESNMQINAALCSILEEEMELWVN
jgi:hypothetical protein